MFCVRECDLLFGLGSFLFFFSCSSVMLVCMASYMTVSYGHANHALGLMYAFRINVHF
jgi:hypothetical protein